MLRAAVHRAAGGGDLPLPGSVALGGGGPRRPALPRAGGGQPRQAGGREEIPQIALDLSAGDEVPPFLVGAADLLLWPLAERPATACRLESV